MSSTIDPVTGLPMVGASPLDAIDQIPLGRQVFPFDDLKASSRMRRQPIYGDDVIPTSALVTGQDTTGKPRAATMDTAQRLYVREAVFQSNGAPIADGKTAPIDVNVTGGGGGGGASMPVLKLGTNQGQFSNGTISEGDYAIIANAVIYKYLYLVSISALVTSQSNPAQFGTVTLSAMDAGNTNSRAIMSWHVRVAGSGIPDGLTYIYWSNPIPYMYDMSGFPDLTHPLRLVLDTSLCAISYGAFVRYVDTIS